MQKSMNVFFGLATSIALCAVASMASAETIALTNPGFELPGTKKIGSGFDTIGSDVPGWSNGAAGTYNDSGVENGGHSGDWTAFLCSVDPDGGSIMQLTSHQIAAGETFTLTFWAQYSYGSGNFLAKLYYIDNSGATVALNSLTTTLGTIISGETMGTSDWAQYTLTASANAASVGHYIGIYFSNVGAGYCHVDDVALSNMAVPEPSAMILASSGLIALLAYAWRKRRG